VHYPSDPDRARCNGRSSVANLLDDLSGPLNVGDEFDRLLGGEPHLVHARKIRRADVDTDALVDGLGDALAHRPCPLLILGRVACCMTQRFGISVPDDVASDIESLRTIERPDGMVETQERSEVVVRLLRMGLAAQTELDRAEFDVADPDRAVQQAMLDWRRREESRD